MAEFILEIGLEEMPAAYINGAMADLNKSAKEVFEKERLDYSRISVFSTPRRLVLYVEGLALVQRDLSEEVKGPSAKAAYKDGGIAKPLEGFLRANGFSIDNVYLKDLPNGQYVFCKREEKGKPTKEILAVILNSLVLNVKFPKNMRWGSSTLRYLRPIRWIVALLDDEVINFSIGDVVSNRYSRGHRTLGHDCVEITDAKAYFDIMESEFVIVDQRKRKDMVVSQVANIFANTDERYQEDTSLLDEVVNLVEYPTALRGNFDLKYLNLPEELIITPMKEHQRYFPVLKTDGSLTNGFITVRNGSGDYIDIVRQGNENVLRARLADAEFFYQEDLKKGLQSGEEKLKNIVFQEKLGSIYQKTQRLEDISKKIASCLNADAVLFEDTAIAARCTKLDLVSNVVSEFPELQGIMGEYYYNYEHPEKRNIGQAIREHYMPRFANDMLPETVEGSIVSVADKIDTIVGCFYAGIIPTGSQDPYALRRQALGLANIIISNKWDVSLENLIRFACEAYSITGLTFNDEKINHKIHQFFEQRILKIFNEGAYPQDVINATMKVGYDNFYDTVLRAQALTTFISTEDKESLKATFDNNGRAVSITSDVKETTIEQELLQIDAEKELYFAVQSYTAQLKEMVARKEYLAILEGFMGLNQVVEAFFEQVLVMDENLAYRNNRLALIKHYSTALANIFRLDEVKGY